MPNFLTSLFDTSDPPARWQRDGGLHALADLGVWAALSVLLVALVVAARRQEDVRFRNLFWLVGAFVLLSGATHLMGAVMFWWPAYRLAGVVTLSAAVVSWVAVLFLLPVLSRAFAVRPPGELEREAAGLRLDVAGLRDLEELMRGALAAAGMGTWNWDLAAKTYWCGSGMNALLGRSEADSTCVGADMLDDVHPADRSRVRSAMDRAVAGRAAFDLEYRFALLGRDLWVRNTGRVQCDAGGRPVAASGVCVDVTGRRRAEAALRESEERLRVALAAAGAIAFVWDAVSDQVVRYHSVEPGLPANVGAPETLAEVQSRVHPNDRALFAAGVRACLASGTEYRNLYRLCRPDGSVRWLDERGTLTRDAAGAPARLVGISVDVTEQKRAEETVREREELLRTIIAHIPCGVFWKDRDSVLLGCNLRFARDFGAASPADLVGTTDDRRAPPAAAGAFVARDRRVMETGEPLLDVEEPLSLPDGRTATLLTSKVPLRGPDGAVVGVLGVYQDITDRKRAEGELRLFRALIDRTTDTIEVIDPDTGRFLDVNDAACASHGYTRDEYLRLGVPDVDAQGGGSWPDLVVSRRLADSSTVQSWHRRKDGSTFPVEVTVNPIRLDRDYLVAVVRDVTDRKRAEAERDDLLARLSLQIERMPLAYLLTDAGFRCTGWNPAAERLFGFTQAEVLGRHLSEVVVPLQSRASVADVFARLAAGDMDAHSTNENVTKDGRTIVCEWHNTPLFGPDSAFQGVLCLAQDVTARRGAEEALRVSEGRKQAVLDVALDAILTMDHRGLVVEANPAAERVFGYPPARMVGRLLADLVVPPSLRDAHRLGLARHLATGEGRVLGRRVEMTAVRADGREFPVEVAIGRIPTDGPPLFTGFVRDLTGQKQLEQQLRQAQKMDAFGQLAGGVAHDFNNLLTIINGYSEMALDALPPGDPARELVGEVLKAGERSAGLTRQLLAFSRQQVLAPRVLDLNGVVADTGTMLRRVIGEDVSLVTTLDPLLWAVRADPGQVEQVLMNLAVNARDAMPTGGRLTIETHNVELDEGYAAAHPAARPGPHVLLGVSDTGTGMSPEVMAKIFEPFFTTKGPGRGTGLGLATVYGIVKQSGGHVAVYSEVGVGTTFKVYLPRAEGDAAGGSRTRPATRALPRGTETVLLAEDEAAVRALARRVLAGCGYTVLEAADGDEAVRVAAGHAGPVHLLVTDVVMPGAGGRAAAEAVTERHPGVRVLFISGYTDDAVLRHGVLAEGVHFLQKPFTPAALALKVRELLDAPSGSVARGTGPIRA